MSHIHRSVLHWTQSAPRCEQLACRRNRSQSQCVSDGSSCSCQEAQSRQLLLLIRRACCGIPTDQAPFPIHLYIINLIWSRQCWRPASSASGGIPAVSSSAQGNWISACIKKKYFLRIQSPSPLLFPLHYQNNWLDSYTTPWLCMSRSNTLLSLSSAYKMTVPPSLTQGPGPIHWRSIHWRFFWMGYTSTVFIRPTQGDAQILQPVEDRAAHLSEHRNGH